MMAASSHAHACIFLYESRPFSVNLSQGFGFESSSDTVPCESPSTYFANSLCPMLCTDSSSRTRRLMCSVSRFEFAYLSILYLSISCSLASIGSPLGIRESPRRPTSAPGGRGPMSSANRYGRCSSKRNGLGGGSGNGTGPLLLWCVVLLLSGGGVLGHSSPPAVRARLRGGTRRLEGLGGWGAHRRAAYDGVRRAGGAFQVRIVIQGPTAER